MSNPSIQGVALTSLWVAAARAVETDRADPLFQDPFARQLAGEQGFEVLRSLDALVHPRPPSLELRTRFIDDAMTGAAAGGIRQIVSLAAGMDARAYRIEWPAGTTYFEVDQPQVIAYKSEKLAGAPPRCDRRAVSLDLREDWPTALRAAGFDAKVATTWLVEGLLLYLQKSEAVSLLQRVSQLASPGSVLLFDLLGRSSLESAWTKPMLDFVAKLGAPWTFGTDEPEALLEPLGWEVDASDVAVVGHRFGRWPFPAMPRGTPGVPQSFFVKAKRR